MAIEILLRKSIESLGRVGEVVRVREGYARNFLLPQGLAVLPTAENLRLVEKDKAAEAKHEAEKAQERAAVVARLAGASVTIEAKSNPEGHLFGSVGPAQVAQALAAQSLPVEERHVRLDPIKELGEYEVLVHLAPDAEATIRLWVVDEVTKQATKKPSDASAAPAPEDAEARGERPPRTPGKSAKPAK